jgi:hypothetical protein
MMDARKYFVTGVFLKPDVSMGARRWVGGLGGGETSRGSC